MKISHRSLFDKLKNDEVILKCEQYANWTLPQLMADISLLRGNGRIVVERDYQEIGALLVNHLATKLAKLLFPTSNSFFRIEASESLKEVARRAGVSEEQFNSSFAKAELESMKRLLMNASYAQLILALKHLIISGNVLLYRDSENSKCCAYGLRSYAVRRDGRGDLIDCVLREFTYVEALPLDIQDLLKSANKSDFSRPEKEVELYTRIHREVRNKKFVYVITQEVDTYPVGEESVYPEHLCPWLAVTWSLIPGEHYGRGLVEDFAGGFAKLSDLSEAHALYSIETMRVVHLVGAGSGTDIDDLAQAETGEYIRGDPNTVQAHESGDAKKLEQTAVEIDRIFQRLAQAFMYQGNTRDAERVTAYELQRAAQEAENALGGAYSSLSTGIHVPLAHILLVETQGSMLPGLLTGEVKLNIVTGIPALGRTSDVQNLLSAGQEIMGLVQLSQADKRLDPQRIVDLVLAGRSVDPTSIMYSQDEQRELAAAEQQQQQGINQLQQAAAAGEQLNMLQQGAV